IKHICQSSRHLRKVTHFLHLAVSCFHSSRAIAWHQLPRIGEVVNNAAVDAVYRGPDGGAVSGIDTDLGLAEVVRSSDGDQCPPLL
ncbi:MAG: hypothetical protein ACR2P4_03170, partial [Gammaproteobacteria bacterium]